MFKTMSLMKKMMGAFIIASLVPVIVGITSYVGFEDVVENLLVVADGNLPRALMHAEMREDSMAVARRVTSIAGRDIPPEIRKKSEERVKSRIEAFEEAKSKLDAKPFAVEANRKLYAEYTEAWSKVKEDALKMVELSQGDLEKNSALMEALLTETFEVNMDKLNKVSQELEDGVELNSNARIGKAKDLTKKVETVSVVITLFGGIGLLLFGYFFASSITKRVNAVVKNLAESSTQVASAATQIASTSEDLSQASTEQAASLEETAASLEQISAMISKASDSVDATATSSIDSHKKAEEGRVAVDQMLNSMDEISQSNEAILTQITESNHQMTDIVKVIQEIGNRTKVINEIVFQTKLLSFNASVEAARAGEHGKGFAVVAEEVGNLAQMSGNAAKEITEMLEGSISKVEKIVDDTKVKVEHLVQKGKEKVDSGVTVAKQCSDVLNEILQNVSRVSGLSQEAASLNSSVAELTGIIGGENSNSETFKTQNTQSDRRSREATPKRKSNLVHIKTTAKPTRTDSAQPSNLRIASGGDSSVPSRDDDGFRDV
ncbi:MAG: hypothetical protein B7Y39_18435 [Bdellovibrio sp. 28-41-41]|nr:MAG: hypothetical protein B7Y39_18435 [Bdellovibrio sp. 28-41-41]